MSLELHDIEPSLHNEPELKPVNQTMSEGMYIVKKKLIKIIKNI